MVTPPNASIPKHQLATTEADCSLVVFVKFVRYYLVMFGFSFNNLTFRPEKQNHCVSCSFLAV